MKTIDVAAFALNIALYVAVGYITFSFIPIKFEQVRFWPPVIVPAVFSVVFGPLVGGLGAAVGIFLSDVILGNNPLLSLMAGVTSNFAAFYLIGYIAKKKTRWAVPVTVYGIATAVLIWIAYAYSNLSLAGKALFMGVAAACYGIFLVPVVIWRNSKWRSFEVGSIVGMLIGAGIIGIMVPVYTQLFAPVAQPFTVPVALATFFFTFLTEIPFLLILGPPIIWAVYRAFPNFRSKEETSEQL
ncbi:MAG TPA: hypothetical protein VLV84_00170 [Candidatus Acidoferrales bacterium]|nr:hypothetical protein [Candidatus Acidoferrales bacterium]